MWIGSIRIGVLTGSGRDDGTDGLVQAAVLRDGAEIWRGNLDYLSENDLERETYRDYWYPRLHPQSFHKTEPLPDGLGQSPMPYPDYGLEFSDGLQGHFRLKLIIRNRDTWVKDEVDLAIREIQRQADGFDMYNWGEDPTWTDLGIWTQDVAMSQDPAQGKATWSLKL